MITFPLKLVYVGEPGHKPAAWLIPGRDPAVWLAEILGWAVPTEHLRLYILPASIHDRRPSGVLVATAGEIHSASAAAIPYGLIAGRLYVPADAALDPPVTDEELARICVWPAAVLHPGVGLIGFTERDALRVRDLLRAPARRETGWDAAERGVGVNQRLESITPIAQPTIQSILDRARDDIGTQPPKDLPPSSEETSFTAGLRARLWMKKKTSDLGRWLIDKAPEGPQDSRLIGALRRWVNDQQAQISDVLQRSRHKELLRLIEQMKKDPDQALRHAIPIADAGTRGVTDQPSSNLPNRTPDFNLKDLRGGRPGEAWQAPPEYIERLRTLYREQANREMSLGRHRRAAFIFAKLLGDYTAAANTLRSGGHFRESAVVYRDFAKMPQMAAACLEQGGLLTEALAEYQQLQLFEKVGDIYERLDEPELARSAYRQEADRILMNGDRVSAATMLERKVQAPNEALELLKAGWPRSSQAALCLTGTFRLLGNLGRHQEALELIDETVREDFSRSTATSLADVLSGTAMSYPDQNVRRLAADSTRLVASACLDRAPLPQVQMLLSAMRQALPHDLLLARDAKRFAAAVAARRPVAVAAHPDRSESNARRFNLQIEADWQVAQASGDCFYLAGPSPDGKEIVLLRGNWEGRQQWTRWDFGGEPDGRILMSIDPLTPLPLLLSLAGGVKRPAGFRMAAHEGLADMVWVTTPAWLHPRTLGFCYGESGSVWSIWRDDTRLTICHHQSTGKVSYTRNLTCPPLGSGDGPSPQPTRVFMVARGSTLVMAIHRYLIIHREAGMQARLLPGEITSLESLVRLTRPHVVATTEQEVTLVTNPGEPEQAVHVVGQDWDRPVACFTTNAMLVVADSNSVLLYRTTEGRPEYLRGFGGLTARPIAITRAGRRGRFAVFTADGVVEVFEEFPR